MNTIDHLVLAGPDLLALQHWFAATSGAPAAPGGQHPAWGTHNALVGLGEQQYLELIAPNPGKTGPWARQFAAFTEPTLAGWCVRSSDLPGVAAQAEALGVETRLMNGSRTTPTGETLSWQLLFLSHSELNPVLPFFIHWGATTHPARELRAAGALCEFSVGHSNVQLARQLFTALNVGNIAVHSTAEPTLRAIVRTPTSEVALLGVLPVSFALSATA